LYGVSCKPAAQPSYHTSFSSAIPWDQLPRKACSTTPTLINPPDGAVLNTLVPLFEWDHVHEPGAIELRLEIVETAPSFASWADAFIDGTLLSKEWRSSRNLKPSTTYYWRVFFVCNETAGLPYETRVFTTSSGGLILPAPDLIAPSDTSTVSSAPVTLQWEAVDGAVEYLVEWGESGQEKRYIERTIDTQFQIDYYLNPDTTYEWSVAARNDYAIGQFATWRFTTSSSVYCFWDF
jgi:hypothetical protein